MMMLGFADSPPTGPAPPDPRQGPQREEVASVGEEVNDVMVTLMPWGISVLFHAGVVLLAVFAVWSTVLPQDEEEETIIPMLVLSATPGTPVQVRDTQRVQSRSQSRQVQQTQESESTLEADSPSEMPLIGVASSSGGGGSPFANESGVAADFATEFMGVRGGNARKVAFVIDAGGSLIGDFPAILRELTRSLQQLNEKQQFTIVFFQGGDAIEVPPRGWKQATSQMRQDAIEWLDPARHNIVPGRNSNPVPALDRALRYQPDLIFLLSDDITGQGPYGVDQRHLLDRIREVNTARTKICTIQFIYRDKLTELGLKGTMQLIAEQSDGVYEFISGREIGLSQ